MTDKRGEGIDPHPDANPDPLTGEPGSHPLGTGIGAVAGAAAGHGAGEILDPTVEDASRPDNSSRRPAVTGKP